LTREPDGNPRIPHGAGRQEGSRQRVDFRRNVNLDALGASSKRSVPFLENRNTAWGLIVAEAPTTQVVLIVEDEALVRMAAVGMVEEAGRDCHRTS
jgi:hypothetical protein